MYAKVHPFGYIRVKERKNIQHDSLKHKNESIHHVQTVRMNGQVRTIKHYCVRSGSLI